MNKKVIKVLAAILAVCLLFGTLIAMIDLFALNENFYMSEYKKLGVAEDIGISEEDLSAATDALLGYVRGEREDIIVNANINGIDREVYNERETAHMVDVKVLYQNAMTLMAALFAAAAAIAVLILVFGKRGERIRAALSGYLYGNLVFLIIIGVLVLYAALDFNSFWTSFHHLFFTNDLWLLDPRTDVLIMMVPSQFFFDLVMSIVLAFVGIGAVLAIVAGVWRSKLKRKGKHAY